MISETENMLQMDSPVGILTLISNGCVLLSLSMEANTNLDMIKRFGPETDSVLREAEKELKAYFAGELRQFSVPLGAHGTKFQEAAWKALTEIPYGETVTYGEQAVRIGSPKGFRAVGMANHCNPIGIIIPCHRVIGASGKLTGYAGGLWRKQYLIEMEQRIKTGITQRELALQV